MNEAIQFIEAIASNLSEVKKPLIDIKNALEDGKALAYLGATDDDQEIVEEAHTLICEWMAEGKEFLGQCQF